MAIEVRRIPATSPDALALIGAMTEEIVGLYGSIEGRQWPRATARDLSPPSGAYVAVYDDGRPVAGGGVKRLEPGVAEIKRMYVVPDARGRGLGRRLLAELEGVARELGYAAVRLDTGAGQPEALALYRSAGYAEVPDYNGNDLAVYWGEKRLG